jgi:inhibitor of KinA
LFLGEQGLILEYGNQIDPVIFGRVRLMTSILEKRRVDGILNLIPTYRSLLVQYDPMLIKLDWLNSIIDGIERDLTDVSPPPGRYFDLPTYYGPPYDYDTDRVAMHNHLTKQEVVRVFSEATLLIYMIGFIGALPYIGGLPGCLHTPRLPSPRVRLPAGVVGVGGQQVAFAPVDMPSGFNYIGRCFTKIYDPTRFPPTPFIAGDRVRFRAVSLKEAERHQGEFPESIG